MKSDESSLTNHLHVHLPGASPGPTTPGNQLPPPKVWPGARPREELRGGRSPVVHTTGGRAGARATGSDGGAAAAAVGLQVEHDAWGYGCGGYGCGGGRWWLWLGKIC